MGLQPHGRGFASGSNAGNARFAPGLSPLGVRRRLGLPPWRQDGDTYYWYHNDHLGTPQQLTDSSGQVVWSASYSAFGEATIDTETITNNLRFPGQYYDAETGLHYNFQRYYDSKIGRYLRTDPLGFLGREVNLYIYGKNIPTNFFDPYGLTSKSDIRDGRLVYSCNCGWIDWGHADRLAIDDERGPLWDGSHIFGKEIGISLGKGWRRSETDEGYLIRFHQGFRPGGGPIRAYLGGAYFVKDGLSEAEKKSVAFAILQDVTYTYEVVQYNLDLIFFWSGKTGFSVEDLPSNLIGLHMAFMGLIPATDENGNRTDREIIESEKYCNVIKDPDILERIWECAFGDVEKLGEVKNEDWRPKNYNECTDCCPAEMVWPFEEVHGAPKGDLWRSWTPTDDGAPHCTIAFY